MSDYYTPEYIAEQKAFDAKLRQEMIDDGTKAKLDANKAWLAKNLCPFDPAYQKAEYDAWWEEQFKKFPVESRRPTPRVDEPPPK